MKNRESGLDVLRLMALFFVNGVHSFLHNGFYKEAQMGAAMWAADWMRWLFYCCIGLFLMLTGYLKSQKKPDRRYFMGLVPILLGYLLTCAISFPIRHFVMHASLSWRTWLVMLITFEDYAWYVEMYIGLLLVSPVINLALQQLKTRKELLTAAGIAFCVTALPSVTGRNLVPDYWEALYPFTYYILGAVIRRLQPEVKLWKGLALTAGLLAALSTVSLLATDDVFTAGYSQGYGGFWVTLITAMIFVSFYKLRLKPRAAKVAAWMAGGCFEGFLLSYLLDVWVYDRFAMWHRPECYLLLIAAVTVPIWLCSILMGKGTHWVVEKLMPLFGKLRLPDFTKTGPKT